MDKKVKRVVLAYSGGLDTSIIIKWIKEEYDCEVVAFVADVGQGGEVKGLRAKAMKTGAKSIHILDLKEEFARDFVFPMIRAGAVYEGEYLLGTAIARPLIAKAQMEVAKKTHSDAVAHGATGKGNDQVRFELTYYHINPDIKVIAPWREWDLKGRSDLIAYAKAHGITVPVTRKKPYSCDGNLLHLSFEGGVLEDPYVEPPEDMFRYTVPLEKAPDKATYIEIDYEGGDAVALNGRRMSPAKLLARLNTLGGANAVGMVDMVESRYVGMKSRGIYETPGGTILHQGRRAVESITMSRDVLHMRNTLIPRYAELIYYGYWYSTERTALQAFFDEAASVITGRARLKLYKGNCVIVGRKAEKSLYNPELATFEADKVYNQRDAEGFIKISSLALKLESLMSKKGPK